MKEYFRKYFFLFKFHFYKGGVFAYYKNICGPRKISQEELLQLSFNRFVRILHHAYENSSFYKAKYDAAGLDLDSIKTPNDLVRIPVLTKKEVKACLVDILTVPESSKFLLKGATGGSTGIPMAFFHDKRNPVEAFAWRYLKWWGINPWDDGAYLWRMPQKTKLYSLLNCVLWWPTKKLRFDATTLNQEHFGFIVNKINKHQPKLIQGYVGSVYEFALYLNENKVKIHQPKAVWVTSAPLMPYQREVIEEVFRAPLFNEYGSSEIPWIAAQQSKDSPLFVNQEGRYIEIINQDDSGEGDLIITDLLNYSFPLIRYELGDRTSFATDYESDINLLAIREVKGRKGDSIEIPGVGKIDASYLTTIFDEYPNATNGFQLIQKKSLDVVLRVVPNYNHPAYEYEILRVQQLLSDKFCDKIKVDLVYLDKILSDRGKPRYILREV